MSPCPTGASISSKDSIGTAFGDPVTRVTVHREGQSHDFPPSAKSSLKNSWATHNLQLSNFYHKPRVSKCVFLKGLDHKYFSCVVSAITAVHESTHSMKAAIDSMQTKGCSCVPIKLSLQQAAGWIWPHRP